MPLSPFIKRRRQQRQRKARNVERERGVTERNPLKKIEATVRKADEEKVENCTEDVDALLVFAGLYSAVLTAFLIESYKNLSADESESLLRQIAFQTANYSFNNGHLNTTFDSSQLPTFQAAVSDIRVNVCWFASLILSLSSASFGIAVKQWLREYLSMDCIDPLERLRIRHARFEGLQDWRLFQIAAFLPILLQIALALFFVGLCFFTAAVHRSIGITSLFLISCWAFLFFMSVIAPLFSPRCPYKTTLLKVPFRYARPYFQLFLQRVLRPFVVVFGCLRKVSIIRRKNQTSGTRTTKTQSRSKGLKWHGDYMDLGIIHELSSGPFRKDLIRGEEDMLRSADDNDIIVFCDVDGVFLDDRLLDSMRRTLGHRLDPLPDVLRFVAAVIQRRSGFTLAELASGNIDRRQPWPWTLSHPLRTALVDMLVNSMEHELLRSSVDEWRRCSGEDSAWSGSFVVLVLLISPRDETPRSVTHLFKGLHEYCSKRRNEWNPLHVPSYQMKRLARSDPAWPARSLLFLAQALNTLDPKDAEWCLRRIAHTTFAYRRGLGEGSADTYRRLLEHHPDDADNYAIAPTPHTIVALLEVARVILHKYTLEQTQAVDKFPEWTSIILEFVFDAVPRVINLPAHPLGEPLTGASDGAGLVRVVAGLFATPHTTRALLDFFVAYPRTLPSPLGFDRAFFLYWIRSLPYPSRDTAILVLDTCMVFFESHPNLDSPVVLLHLCLLAYCYNIHEDEEVDACWRKLSTIIPARYERILNESSNTTRFEVDQYTCRLSDYEDQHKDTCEIARNILDHCDLPWHRHKVPNEMVDFLRTFMCASRNAIKFDCLPNLDSTEKRQAEAAASERSHHSSGGEQKMVLPDAISSHPAAADRILLSPTLVSNAYDRHEVHQPAHLKLPKPAALSLHSRMSQPRSLSPIPP